MSAELLGRREGVGSREAGSREGGSREQQEGDEEKDRDGNESVESGSSGASRLSALAAWSEDPQVREKVRYEQDQIPLSFSYQLHYSLLVNSNFFFRRLKEAKEKLHCLQDLVAMVQEAPEVAEHLPDDLDAFTSSLQTGADNAANAVASASDQVPPSIYSLKRCLLDVYMIV